ncbi:unnamed protein product [Closterium sp. NIES-65]|nr:unnamed protein product [Closterium sp. NIES-65]
MGVCTASVAWYCISLSLVTAALVAAQSSDELLLGRVAEMEEQLNQQLLDGPADGTSQPAGAATTKAAATGGSGDGAAVESLPPRPTFTEGLLKTTTLPRGIYRNKLNSTFLEYHRNVHKGEVELHCMGGTCPNLDSCGSAFPNVRACFWPNLVDEDYIYPDQPENCPKLSNWDEVGAKGADPRCTHPGDNLRFDKYVPQYYEIKDVFVDANGVLFNESLHFFRHGCFKDKEFAYHANQTSVQHYHRLISLLYQLGGAFYHTLIEVVPHFLLLAPLLKDNPGMPIAVAEEWAFYHTLIWVVPHFLLLAPLLRDNPDMPIAVSRKQASAFDLPAWWGRGGSGRLPQLKMYDSVLHPIVGITSRVLNLVLVDDRNQKMLLHADMAYQPVFQACGRAAPAVWRELRRRYLVPSDGLPMVYAFDGELNVTQAKTVFNRAAVFVGLYGAGLANMVFMPLNASISSKTVFNRAAVFVGLHGAGLANMVFMPLNASIFEIRPRGYPNPCYHHLATATQMHYHLILGNGTKDSELKFNHTEAVEVLRLIANRTRARMSAEKFESINLLPPLEAVGEEDWKERAGLDGEEEEENGGGGNAELTIPLELMADVTLKALNDTDVGAEEQEEEVKSLDEETKKKMEGERVVTIGELSEDLKRAEMKQVHVNSGVSHDKRKAILNCTGGPCPDFSGRCESNREASACRMNEVSDEGFARPAIPINCPKKGNLTTVGPEGRDESCSHTSDFGWYEPGTFQIYLLRGVYIDHEGHVFNKTTHFNREGCNNDAPFEYKKGTKVHRLKRVVNLAYYQGRNFYHGLIEWTPQLFLLSSLLHAHPTIPLLAIHDQWDFYENISKPIIGVEQFAMNRLNISRGELFYADEVYLPLYQACGKASPSLWSLLRSHFLLAPQGLPIFPPTTWIQRPGLADPVNQTEAATVPPDWMVLLVRRPGVKRSLDRWDALYESAVSVFSLNRVHVLNGSVPMLKARSLFRRARLLIAGHGAAMANMVFMRPNMTVYEIRPDKSNNACYHHLAHACGLRYYLTFGDGDGESVVKIDVGKVTGVLKEIAKTVWDVKGGCVGDVKGGCVGDVKGGCVGDVKGGCVGDVKGGCVGDVKGGCVGDVKGGCVGDVKGGCVGDVKGGCVGDVKGGCVGDVKGGCVGDVKGGCVGDVKGGCVGDVKGGCVGDVKGGCVGDVKGGCVGDVKGGCVGDVKGGCVGDVKGGCVGDVKGGCVGDVKGGCVGDVKGGCVGDVKGGCVGDVKGGCVGDVKGGCVGDVKGGCVGDVKGGCVGDVKGGCVGDVKGGCVGDVKGGCVGDVKGGCVGDVKGGCVGDVKGGCVGDVKGGCVGDVKGGCVGDVKGGCVGDVKGGCVGDVKGGCVGDVKGGCVGDVKGGCVGDVKGGCVRDVKGGCVGDVKGGCVGDVKGGCVGDVLGYGVTD